jgi:hypothetical protein
MTKFGAPQMDLVIALHNQGIGTTVIAREADMSIHRVKAIIAANRTDHDRFKRITEMKRRGMTDSDIARAEGLSKQYVSRLTGVRRSTMGDKHSYALTMDQGHWRKLQVIAEEFGLIVDDGHHAGKGSVRKLLEHIALGNITVLKDRSVF